MASLDTAIVVFEELRRLAAESPRDARAKLAVLLDSGDPVIEETLRFASAPGEGRLRQLIANAVRNRRDKARVIPHLMRWLELETDEFAKQAISGALSDVEQVTYQAAAEPAQPQLVDTYRYVADRLCHRVRNSLTGPAQHLRKLETLLNSNTDPITAEAKATVIQLKDALRVVSRVVEFDIDDKYFQWRSIELQEWIRSLTVQYIAKNSLIKLNLLGKSDPIRIRANDYLLETLFWNLWKNAQQVVGLNCEITINFAVASGHVQLLISDNGRGFTSKDAEVAFIDQFERRGSNYGRGLLEVHDAVRRLSGSVKLTEVQTGEFRVLIRFPLALL